ncbi:MAG: carbohydrate kinase family protein [Candidatus Magasanikbacteria bacterium]|nr:carbohydrate kinase family protein [Candidatus Magasanikbacteria bacterium]
MYDIISIGDTTVDVFLILDDASVQCDLDKTNCKLCINYADKIAVKEMAKVNAVGNAANNAVASSRLGMKTALVSIVGNDDSGHGIFKILKEEKVNTKFVSVDHEHGTNYSTVLDYKGERTILVYHEHRKYHWQKIPASHWLYFTSMGQGHEAMFPALLDHVKKSKTKMVFNPGTHQLKLGIEKLKPILAGTHVLCLNKEEGVRLAGKITDIKKLMQALRVFGPKIVVVTDGQAGAYAYDGKQAYFCPIFPAPIVERTGCGDAFASGFIGALYCGKDIPEAMKWGSINAAGVLQHIGAQKGLQTKRQIMHQLRNHDEFQVRIIS